MRKIIIAAAFLCCFDTGASFAQTFIPAVRFYYDNSGKRFLRKMGDICIGEGCPFEEPPLPFKGVPPKDSANGGTAMDNIVAYPNPVTEELSVDNRTWKDGSVATFIVYDMNGKVVIKKELTEAKGSVQFHGLAPGTYMAQYYINGTPLQEWKIVRL